MQCDYSNIPLVLFTPLEYSACGLSEERANATFGEANIEVYTHTHTHTHTNKDTHMYAGSTHTHHFCEITDPPRHR